LGDLGWNFPLFSAAFQKNYEKNEKILHFSLVKYKKNEYNEV